MSESFDLALIGGGLAGLSLAIQVARLGHRVVLFEKNQYPFHKVCGEYIAMESWDHITQLGVPLASMALPRITRLQVSDPAGRILNHPLEPGGFGISRYLLDHALADLARAAGVSVIEKTTVKGVSEHGGRFAIESPIGEVSAAVVAGSYGKYANLDVKLGRGFIAPETRASAFAAVKYHIQHDVPDDLIVLHNFAGGYCGMSRIEDGKSCLCYLVRAEVLKTAGGIQALEAEIMSQNPHLKRIFASATPLYAQPLAISQIHFSPKQLIEQHVLMLGDAAGLIPPLCGNGMSMALRASSLLAPLLDDFYRHRLDRDGLEQAYTQAWQQAFATRLRTGRLLQHLFGRPAPVSWALRLLRPLPRAVNKLVALTHGEAF
ncbi:MAG: pyridine nucleotide-disulfide oxidoreductase [Candidatus Melainabacteria bacterium HGW-Melainabacteria-1]|nr:MAG: pyridine nucleotide-disulfide oxidoreductase [Candidatus Melainabacteria bacterium HGW-Melainabacteria-1]